MSYSPPLAGTDHKTFRIHFRHAMTLMVRMGRASGEVPRRRFPMSLSSCFYPNALMVDTTRLNSDIVNNAVW